MGGVLWAASLTGDGRNEGEFTWVLRVKRVEIECEPLVDGLQRVGSVQVGTDKGNEVDFVLGGVEAFVGGEEEWEADHGTPGFGDLGEVSVVHMWDPCDVLQGYVVR